MSPQDANVTALLEEFYAIPSVPNNKFNDHRTFTDRNVFDTLDFNYPPLHPVKVALENDDLSAAKTALIAHFRTRTEPNMAQYRTDPHWSDWGNITVIDRADAMCEGNLYKQDGSLATSDINNSGGSTRQRALINLNENRRQGVLATLSCAWSLTDSDQKKKRYVNAFQRWFKVKEKTSPFMLTNNFHREEFSAFGSRGNEQMTTSYRLFNIGDVLDSDMFRTPGVLPDDFAFTLLKWYALRAFNYTRLIGSSWRADNHHLMERGVTLYFLGVLFPEFLRAKEMEDYARLIILRHFDHNLLKDDVGSEHCSSYNFRCFIRYVLPYNVAQINGRQLFDTAREKKLLNWLEYYIAICAPDGRLATTGDGKGTTLSFIAQQAGSMLSNAAMKGVWESLEITGPINPAFQKQWDQLSPVLPEKMSSIYPHAGHIAMRDGWKKESMFLHTSIKRDSLYNVHTHWNMYEFTFAVHGKRLIGNPTARTYGKPKGDHRGFYFSMDAHNTLMIDNDNLKSHRALSDSWGLQPTRIETARTSLNIDNRFDYATFTHVGYDPLTHRRDILMVRNRYVLMTDGITMDFSNVNAVFGLAGDIRPHTYRQRIHFEKDVQATAGQSENSVVAMDKKSSAGVLIIPEAFENLHTSITPNEYLRILNSPDFQGYEMADIHRETIGPCMFSTLYYPFSGETPSHITVTALTPKTTPYRDDIKHCIRIDDGEYVDYWFVQRDQLAPVNQLIDHDSITLETDAAVVFISTKDDIIVDGFKIGGHQVIVNGQPATILDAPLIEHL